LSLLDDASGFVTIKLTLKKQGIQLPDLDLLETTLSYSFRDRTLLERAITHAHADERLGDLCAAIEDEARRSHFSVVREFVGHGVGRKLHEEPQVPNFVEGKATPKLRPGMTIAIEPMVTAGLPGVKVLNDGWTVVTQDGSLSAHFEHTVLVTESEPEILTWPERMPSKLKV